MRSGTIHTLPLNGAELNPEDPTPDACTERFFDGLPLGTLATLRVSNMIFYTREIESLEFAE
jgi:hypothetical protein